MAMSNKTPAGEAPNAAATRWWALRYGFALLATGLALPVTFALGRYAEQTPFLAFYTAVAITAWYGGLGPALLTTALSVVAADYFFIPPIGALTKAPDDVVVIALFVVVAIIISSLSESLRGARARAERQAAEAATLAEQLKVQAEELERRAAESEALVRSEEQANEQLRATAEGQQFLLEAARALGSSLDMPAVLREVANLVVPRFADYCLVYLRQRDGAFVQVASAHVDRGKAPLLEELGRIHQPDLTNLRSLVGRALSAGRPLVTASVAPADARLASDDSAALRIFDELAPISYAILPLIARGELLGAASLMTSVSGRRLDSSELTLLELFSARAALAIDNARLHTAALEAREQVVRTSQLEAQVVHARLDALRAQLNPHFLFNAFNTVAMLVRRKANADALKAIVSLSQVLRQALAGDGAKEVALREELSLVDHYLRVEQLRFRDQLRVSVDVEAEALDASVPSLVLQPLVENAIRHGVARRGEGGRVEIAGRHERGTLVLQVRDDGPGFPRGWDPVRGGRVGLANTRERLERLYGSAFRLETSNAPSGGAVVTVEIPYRAHQGGRA
jgi:K+-sensing histidine kinase KdpD